MESSTRPYRGRVWARGAPALPPPARRRRVATAGYSCCFARGASWPCLPEVIERGAPGAVFGAQTRGGYVLRRSGGELRYPTRNSAPRPIQNRPQAPEEWQLMTNALPKWAREPLRVFVLLLVLAALSALFAIHADQAAAA